jgi:hypothetical protein
MCAEQRNAGLADAVLSGTLRYAEGGRIRPFTPIKFGAELLTVADAAIADRMPLGVVLCLPGTSAPLLLGAAGVVGAILKCGNLTVEVAVASPNLTSRTLYDELYIREQRLADFIPRTRLDLNGNAHVMGNPRHDAGGRLHLTGALDRVTRWLDKLDALIVDGATTNPEVLRTIVERSSDKTALIYLTSDPADAGLVVLRDAGGAVWGWDTTCLRQLIAPAIPGRTRGVGPVVAPVLTLQRAADSMVTILCPESDGELDAALTALWRALAGLSAAYRIAVEAGSGWVAADATMWAWGVSSLIGSLATSPQAYDAVVGYGPYRLRLNTAPATARAFGRNIGGQAGEAWYRVADAFEDALTAACRQEKLSSVIGWLDAVVKRQHSGLLVARNASAAVAVAAALAASPKTPFGWEQYVKVVPLADLVAGRCDPVANICITGTLPRYRAGLFAMPPAPNLTVIVAGSSEADRLAKQALSARTALTTVRAESVNVTAERLSVRPSCTTVCNDPAAQVRIDRRGRVHPVSSGVLVAGENPWEPFTGDVVELLERTTGAASIGQEDLAVIAPARIAGSVALTRVPVIGVHLAAGTEGAVLLLEPNDLVTRRRGTVVARVAAKALNVGDVVVLVDRGARQDLLGAVIAKLAEHPVYGALKSLVDFWHQRAWRARDAFTYGEILTRMKGSSITTEATIGNWVRGDVGGPADHEDVARFARAVGDDELLAKARDVGRALTTLNTLHRKVGIWLSAQMAGATRDSADTLVDARLNIHVADLMEAVTSHKVTLVDTAMQSAPASVVGVVLTLADALRVTCRGESE